MILTLIALVIGYCGGSESEPPLAEPRIRISGPPNARYSYTLEQYGHYGDAGIGLISSNFGAQYIPELGIVEKALKPQGVGYYLSVAPEEIRFEASGDANDSNTNVAMKSYNPSVTFVITLLDGETVVKIKSSNNRRRMAVIDYGEIPNHARPVTQ
ncbi:hypothetical protein IQ260_29485 [Leptolyngbya cf. ectocarpi LEGE 11479]|uniref:Uncharacterized protein n=1 Tax=Leptolyngbya cf. ectocarpi LEGE 11479 TaxID=1828722 RepID=A0A929FB03_LEPEC|nr:hypothetical protein [Leptolyngbya cf. ectocarpi LEGE 11479]